MEVIKGNDLILSLDGAAIAAAKSCDIKIDTDAQEVANATSGQWRKYMLGRSGWNITSGGLLTSLTNARRLQRSTVALTVSRRNMPAGLPFSGLVAPASVLDYGGPDIIVWDTSRKKFLGEFIDFRTGDFEYYLSWEEGERYMNPSDGDFFTYQGVTYMYLNGDLVPEKLTGTALVTGCQITATRGTLAQCSITLLGSGELAAATLTSGTRSAETDADATEGGEFARQHK
jgi:hypothetical protein